MSDLVNPEDIERIVGIARHRFLHIGRAVSAEHVFYILHSQECKDSGRDLRECAFSLALDNGIERESWEGREDRPVSLAIQGDQLIPVKDMLTVDGYPVGKTIDEINMELP